MLYVTTRNRQEAYTAQHTLTQARSGDGGLYVPRKLPQLSRQERRALEQMSFGQSVAQILNMFFSTGLTGWDIDFAVGRYPVRLAPLAHRIFMAETWHNPQWQYGHLEKNLLQLIQAETLFPGSWGTVAVRMAVLGGILGSRELTGAGPVDIAAVSGDFLTAVSCWYLRKMGFPVGNIICCCNENNQFWELVCNGQMRTDAVCVSTIVPEADITLPMDLERLISDLFGPGETERYLECCRNGGVYTVPDPMLQQLRQGISASVISSSRVETTIPNVYKTHKYVLSPGAALAYAGLLDHRAKTGTAGTAIVLSDRSPGCDGALVAGLMDIPVTELKKIL